MLFKIMAYCNKTFHEINKTIITIPQVSNLMNIFSSASNSSHTASTDMQNDGSGSEIKSFVFMDSETTGLPYQEFNKTKITELCFIVVESRHVSLGCYPRVQNKLNFCFNPCKLINPTATNITGLSNDLLEFQPKFDPSITETIKCFLKLYPQPICFVAHNGNQFDYPILKAALLNSNEDIPGDIYCVDSLELFRLLYKEDLQKLEETDIKQVESEEIPFEFLDEYDAMLVEAVESIERKHDWQQINETTPKQNVLKVNVDSNAPSDNSSLYYEPGKVLSNVTSNVKKVSKAKKSLNYGMPSFKLSDVFTRLTNRDPVNAHRAESDCDMLIHCVCSLGNRFINLANEKKILFKDIAPLGARR